MNDQDVRIVATHEAGHVVSEVLNPGIVNMSSVRQHTGNSGGITRVSKPECFDSSFKLHEDNIIRSLGGKAAVEIVYGVPDMGSETDFEMAFKILDHFTTELHIYGFDAHSNYDDSE